MKWNKELNYMIDRIRSIITLYKEGQYTEKELINRLEVTCNEYKEKYCCPYEDHTAEWYDEHGEYHGLYSCR